MLSWVTLHLTLGVQDPIRDLSGLARDKFDRTGLEIQPINIVARGIFLIEFDQDLVRGRTVRGENSGLHAFKRRQVFCRSAGEIDLLKMPIRLASLVLAKKDRVPVRCPSKKRDPAALFLGKNAIGLFP